ncbi:MAG: hypothetical protein AAF530_04805 [Pseudomonadota bacterium]
MPLFCLAVVWPASLYADSDPYYDLIYDFEVTVFCGIVDEDLHAAYAAKRGQLEAQDKRNKDQLTRVRIKAMAAADREYNNRGLGGHRQWCESDGRAGAERIYPNRMQQ